MNRPARTKDMIRAEALRLFAARGYEAVSMRDIAGAVGVQPGAIYNHFPNKQQLLFALLGEHMERLAEAWEREAAALPAEPAARLEAFARFHIRFHIERPDEVFLSYMELRALVPELFVRIEAQRRAYEGALKAILEEGAAAGAFTVDDPHVTAMALLAMLTGVNTWYRSGGRLSKTKIENYYAALVLRAVQCV
ncbi:TetR/AcrR family transcriptional regulator [Actibacterium ureilyticum]|uniref:TetR/AcrR family transcriptional regulator n=1 Tax=Actibacterium ureilyticum TaxID=1590614 RepID=UPI000BAA99F4|nr:TetR/AcrR family transcriptional regulator [Actibacterium ureilyticum]